jgi:hypothetical protein
MASEIFFIIYMPGHFMAGDATIRTSVTGHSDKITKNFILRAIENLKIGPA